MGRLARLISGHTMLAPEPSAVSFRRILIVLDRKVVAMCRMLEECG